MQVRPEDELADVIRCCLPQLDVIESAFIEQHYLRVPKTTLAAFAAHWQLSAKALAEVRGRALGRLRELLGTKNISSIGDIL